METIQPLQEKSVTAWWQFASFQSLQGWCFVLGDAQKQGDIDKGRENTIHLSSYPKAPVQEPKQLLPQLHKPLHLPVNMSDFVTLIRPYFAMGRKKKYKISLENK